MKSLSSVFTEINLRKVVIHLMAFIFLGTGALTLFAAQPGVAQAQAGDFSMFTVPFKCQQKECGWPELIMLANEIIKFAVYIACVGATITFAWAGFKMLMNAGSSGEIEKAKKMMWTAIIGIVITLSAWLIVKFILDNLGVDPSFRTLVQ